MAAFLTCSQLTAHFERVLSMSKDKEERLICEQTLSKIRNLNALNDLASNVVLVNALLESLETKDNLSTNDKETIVHWISLILRWGACDLKDFTKKLASNWLANDRTCEYAPPVPAEYAYKQSKGER